MKHYMKGGNEVLSFKRVMAPMAAVVVVALLLVASPSLVSADDPDELEAKVLLREVDGSGVNGKVDIKDNGSGVSVKGKAKGLNPSEDYFSLFYDILSASTGPKVCRPGRVGNQKLTVDDAAFITDEEMGEPASGAVGIDGFALVWDVEPDGDGRLKGTVADVGLDRIRTMSIRKCDTPGDGCDPAPGQSDVVACGLIVIDD